MNRKWFLPSLTLIILLAGLFSGAIFMRTHQATYLRQHFVRSSTPTIFVHGWTGDRRSEQEMVDAAETTKVAKHVMTIRVTPAGKLHFKGHLSHQHNNPIVEVLFENNRAGEIQDARWLQAVMQKLRQQYHVTRYNAVGHSMGAYAWVYYNLMVGRDKRYPQLNRAVLIAGPYDGIINNHKLNQPTEPPLSKLWDDKPNENRLLANGKPKIIRPEFQLLLEMQKNAPRQARILNIYGNLEDGSNSDGVISIPSARSLGYLLKGRVKEYRELEVTGHDAQHSRLHRGNLDVDQGLINFIWRKDFQVK